MRNILIVEDEQTLGKIYKTYLADAGYTVNLATTVREAMEYAKDFVAHLILLDHGLPNEDHDGIELIPDFKKLFPEAKIILFSNYSLFDVQERALAAGADDCWVKLDMRLKDLADRIGEMELAV